MAARGPAENVGRGVAAAAWLGDTVRIHNERIHARQGAVLASRPRGHVAPVTAAPRGRGDHGAGEIERLKMMQSSLHMSRPGSSGGSMNPLDAILGETGYNQQRDGQRMEQEGEERARQATDRARRESREREEPGLGL